ncbi:MAG: YhdT family protein [Selenomonadaceae bacterium]|nr:YhdT family protein [Selenomonadaceae bacterium]
MTDYEKLQQIKKEAVATGVALIILIIFWCAAGFGVSGVDVKMFNLPLWSVTGTVGVWIFAMALVWFLLKFFFKDMDLGEENTK